MNEQRMAGHPDLMGLLLAANVTEPNAGTSAGLERVMRAALGSAANQQVAAARARPLTPGERAAVEESLQSNRAPDAGLADEVSRQVALLRSGLLSGDELSRTLAFLGDAVEILRMGEQGRARPLRR